MIGALKCVRESSGVPTGRGSIFHFPGARSAGLLSDAPLGRKSSVLIPLHHPRYSSHVHTSAPLCPQKHVSPGT
jgi:hypothetical protein